MLVLAAAALWAGVSFITTAAEPPDIAALAGRIEQQRIHDHIDAIDEPRSAFSQPEALQTAADYVDGQLRGFGYPVTLEPVTHGDVTFPNVVAAQEGTACPERVFIVGAHYDSVADAPGADDDATGIAAMLEIARALAGTPLPVTVRFAGFTMEEDGLVGSWDMAVRESAAGTPIVGMVSLEMVGYTTETADFVAVIGSEESVRLADAYARAQATYVPELASVVLTVAGHGEEAPNVRRSDHAPFWDMGWQALLVTDTANFRNPNYHQPTDTLGTLDLEFTTNVAKAILATTVDYLTRDEDGDGRADACAGPLSATATQSATATPNAAATPNPSATATPGGVTELPSVGGLGPGTSGSERDGFAVLPVAVVVAVLGSVAAVAAVRVARRR